MTTITLSDRAPVKIDTALWPRIASASAWNGEHESQANRVDTVTVREHADGRRIVYASHERGGGGMSAGEREIYAGYLLAASDAMAADGSHMPNENATIRAIRRVADAIGAPELAAECIGDLPIEEI